MLLRPAKGDAQVDYFPIEPQVGVQLARAPPPLDVRHRIVREMPRVPLPAHIHFATGHRLFLAELPDSLQQPIAHGLLGTNREHQRLAHQRVLQVEYIKGLDLATYTHSFRCHLQRQTCFANSADLGQRHQSVLAQQSGEFS